MFNEDDIRNFPDQFDRIRNEIGKSIIGQKEIISNVLISMIAGGNVLLEGLPGLGKTQLIKTIGKVLDLEFSRIQFTPDLMPSDVTGTDIMNREDGAFRFQKGPVFSNIVLADEINRATPKTQSSLLEAMQEKTVTAGINTYKLPSPFFVLATQNPIELEGTYPLPEAQMDRFLFKLNVSFPNKSELMKIVALTTGRESQTSEKICNGETILKMGEVARSVPIAESVFDYAMQLILNTHPENEDAPEITKKYVRYGSSPRGAQAIISAARIFALLERRYNVAYDDIKKAALPVLRHRVFLNFEAAADNIDADHIIRKLTEV
ncbi:MAG: MoxR family ATPase [Firmicutes bacterium]|nr:MoxR family ATPase [Bacillota bacterium]